jgi:hypothetical protein
LITTRLSLKLAFTRNTASFFKSALGAEIKVGDGAAGAVFGPIKEAIAIAIHPAHIEEGYTHNRAKGEM